VHRVDRHDQHARARERPAVDLDRQEPSAAAYEYDLTELRMAVRLDAPAVGAAAVGRRFHVDEPVAGEVPEIL
jgi:hypothetical protein